MFSVKQISIATVGTMAIGFGSVAPVEAASFYQVTGLDFRPADINDRSQIVGENYLWQNGSATDIRTFDGANSSEIFATAINNNGAIVGGGLTLDELDPDGGAINNQAFISNGTTVSHLLTDYSCYEGYCDYNTADDINDSGTVALNYGGYLGVNRDSNGTTTEVLFARGIDDIAINNEDQVVSSVIYSGGSAVGTYADNTGQGTDLVSETEPEDFYRLFRSTANDINDTGNIVGSGLVSTSLDDDALEATLWTDPSQPGESLGTLGGEESEAFGINNLQQIVGVSTLLDGSTEHAFLWENGDLIDLNSLIDPESGWLLTSALEINDSGDIIGIGLYNGVQRGFYAQAVPEPSSVLGILGLGAFGLSNWLKRQQRKN